MFGLGSQSKVKSTPVHLVDKPEKPPEDEHVSHAACCFFFGPFLSLGPLTPHSGKREDMFLCSAGRGRLELVVCAQSRPGPCGALCKSLCR